MRPLQFRVTIPSGGSLSGAVDLGETLPVAVVMPSAWDAAALTFQGSLDGSSFLDLYSTSGSELQVSAAANRIIALDPAQFRGARFLKVRSGTSATPVNQTATRSLLILTVPSNTVS